MINELLNRCSENLHFLLSRFRMQRHPEHFMTFLLAEIGTSGSLDRHERLVFKGRFASKSIEVIVRRYIGKFIIIIMFNGSLHSFEILWIHLEMWQVSIFWENVG